MSPRRESGESLVELIIAMAILGVAMVTIIGGFLGLSRMSGIQRDQAKAFLALTAASEFAKNRSCARAPFPPPCDAASTVPSSSVPHDADTTITIGAHSTDASTATGLTKYVVTVTTGSATLSNAVVVR
jgi:hypothetical protein